jgi:hypothetical protein
VSTRFDPRMHLYDDQSRHAGVLYVLMLVVAVAFGGFVWQLYSAPETPQIAAPPGPYKVAPPPESPAAPDQTEQTALQPEPVSGASASPQPAAAAELPASPHVLPDGPYVAQLAALQSEAAVEQAWRRLSTRAPQLFASARLDVMRADLGPRGVYYRVRAGYFSDRANASRFCERIRQLGQDCIVAAR